MKVFIFVPEYREGTTFVTKIQNCLEKPADIGIIYIRKEVNTLQQQQFLYAVHVADIVIVDCTIPADNKDGGVYPALTAQINSLNHIIVVSENNLPLNITPYRGVYPKEDGKTFSVDEIVARLPEQINATLNEDTYDRLPEDMYQDFMKYQLDMEKMLEASLQIRKQTKSNKIRVMISYRNCHSEDADFISFRNHIVGIDAKSIQARQEMGCPGDYELKVLPPASLCGADEAHTPMRRWMLVGMLEDHIREVDEVWVYESHKKEGDKDAIDYTDSWWTMAEMVMVANINYSRAEQIRVRVYNPIEHKFYPETPQRYLVEMSPKQHKKLARYLSNTRPDTMGPECMDQVKQLKMIANLMRKSPASVKEQMLENLRVSFEQSVPRTIPENNRKEMIDNMMAMYSDPDEIERYTDDDVFKESFWNIISYQTKDQTSCFENNRIDVDKFMSIPMIEVTGKRMDDFQEATTSSDGKINLGSWMHPQYYKVTKAKIDRFLWLATRMGKPTIKDGGAPGLERIPIYNVSR